MNALDLGIVAGYVVGILTLGFAVSRRITGFRDYFIAGAHMGTPMLVCTLVSTYYGLDVLFGGSEVGYTEGLVGWFWYTRPYYAAILIAAFLLARRLRSRDFLSLPDVAASRFGRPTQVVVAAASFFYSLPLLAIMGIGVLLDAVLGVPLVWGIILGAATSLAYTLAGGLLADALTDTVQFTLMCVTLGIAAILALDAAGGVAGVAAALPASYFDPRGTYPAPVLLVFSLSALSVLVEPAFYQRIYAAKSTRAVFVALLIGIVLWAAFDWIVNLLGMVAAARGYQTEPRYALITLTMDVLPLGLRGLFVSGVIATAMSTIDSYLLIAGGNLAYDLWRPLARPQLDDRGMLRLTRWMVAVSAAVCVVLALLFRSMVSAWVFMSSTLVSAALIPVLAALYAKRPLAPLAGLLSSLGGLLAAAGVYGAVNLLGRYDAEWSTMIYTLRVGGRSLDIWQEYAVLIALPVSALGFLAGQAVGRKR